MSKDFTSSTTNNAKFKQTVGQSFPAGKDINAMPINAAQIQAILLSLITPILENKTVADLSMKV